MDVRARALASTRIGYLAAAGSALTFAAPVRDAQAEVALQVTAHPGVVRSAGVGQSLTFDVRVTAEAQDERFALAVELPVYASRPGWPERSEGSPLLADGLPTVIEGPATFTGGAGGTQARPGCSPRWPGGFHGFEIANAARDVLVPANTTSVLRYVYAVTPQPLWPDADLRVRFSARASSASPVPARPVGTVSSPIRIVGRVGARLSLRFSPALPNPQKRRAVEVKSGKPLPVIGAIDPPLANAAVRLYRVPPNTASAKVWKTVRTDGHGRFRIRVSRASRGFKEIWPVYRSTRRSIADDHACPLTYRVR